VSVPVATGCRDLCIERVQDQDRFAGPETVRVGDDCDSRNSAGLFQLEKKRPGRQGEKGQLPFGSVRKADPSGIQVLLQLTLCVPLILSSCSGAMGSILVGCDAVAMHVSNRLMGRGPFNNKRIEPRRQYSSYDSNDSIPTLASCSA